MNDIVTTTHHHTGLPHLIEEDGDVRVLDLALAERLGYERPRAIRDLIKRHRAALEVMGSLPHRAANPGRKGGRPAQAFYLTHEQAVFLIAKSETVLSDIELAHVAQVFTLYRQGDLVAKDDEAQAQIDAIEAKRLERIADWEDDKRVRPEVLRSMGRYRPRTKAHVRGGKRGR